MRTHNPYTKKNIGLYLLMWLCFFVFMVAVSANKASAVGGTRGENAYWEVNEGVLRIYGEGEINWPGWRSEDIGSICSVVIEDGITNIPYSAFSGWSSLTSITIPEGVTNIGSRAFSDCSGLTSITIPEGVTSIGYSAFSGCSGLTNITIPCSVTSIHSNYLGLNRNTTIQCPAQSCAEVYAKQNNIPYTTIPHSAYSDWAIITEADCVADGVREHTCSICGYTEQEVIPSSGHHRWGTWTSLNENQHQRVCANNKTHVEKANHTWDGGSVTKQPTQSAEGVKTYTCTSCKATRTESIAKLPAPAPTPQPTPAPAPAPTTGTPCKPMYRLYYPGTHEHFYTSDVNEKNVLTSPARGWQYEGIAWYAPLEGDPVYRLFNPYTTDHHYTTDYNEYRMLGLNGWNQEGVGWYSDPNHGKTLYRLFTTSLVIGSHHYTADANERRALLNSGVWQDEGIAWYGVK